VRNECGVEIILIIDQKIALPYLGVIYAKALHRKCTGSAEVQSIDKCKWPVFNPHMWEALFRQFEMEIGYALNEDNGSGFSHSLG